MNTYKHQRGGVSMKSQTTTDSLKSPIRLHLRRVSKIARRKTSPNLLRLLAQIGCAMTG